MPFACSLGSLSGWVLKSLTTNRIEGFTLYTRCNDKSKKRFDTETLQGIFGEESIVLCTSKFRVKMPMLQETVIPSETE